MSESFRKMGRRVWNSRPGGKTILPDVLRALGLRSFVHLFRGLRRSFRNHHKPEAPKRVLRRSRLYATSRSVVHLIPMTVLAWMLFFNYRTVYYGPGLSVFNRSDPIYFALFQVAAKIVELACLASLCTILLHALRGGLLHGDRVSLGLLTSPSWFASPIYLLSPEFLSAVQTGLTRWWQLLRRIKHTQRLDGKEAAACWRRTRLTILLLIISFIAALIGPSSAVLLIPRNQIFPAGGVTYFLNATFDEMWPSVVSSDAELDVCSEPNATLYPVCPSGGYTSLRHQGGFNGIYDTTNFYPNQIADTSIWFISSLVLDPLNIVPAMLSAGADRLGQRPLMPTHIIQPNLYTTVLLQLFFRDWMSAIIHDSVPSDDFSNARNYKYADAVKASALSTHPITHVRCSVPQNLTSHAEIVGFHFVNRQPLTEQVKGWSEDNVTKPVNITALRRDPNTHIRAQWIPLPNEDFDPVTTGMLLELPWSSSGNGGSRLVVSCTVVAAWAQGRHAKSERTNNFAWFVGPANANSDAYKRNITINTSAADVKAGNYNRRIELTKEWLDLLTPTAPDPPLTNDPWQPSTLENIFHAAGFDTLMEELRYQEAYISIDGRCGYGTMDPSLTDQELWDRKVCNKGSKISFIERTLARLVTDGLSRRLSYRAFTMVPNLRSWVPHGETRNDGYSLKLIRGNPEPSENAIIMPQDSTLITQRLEIAVNGYGYKASSTTDYIATVIVVMYLLLATSHVVWTVLFQPVTSVSWDSALELLLLAFNSPPAPFLRGTSAEIHRWDTYKRGVRVRAERLDAPGSDPAVNDSELHLRLLVEADLAESDTNAKTHPPPLDPGSNTELPEKSLKPPAVNVDGRSQNSHDGSQASIPPQRYLGVEMDKKYY